MSKCPGSRNVSTSLCVGLCGCVFQQMLQIAVQSQRRAKQSTYLQSVKRIPEVAPVSQRAVEKRYKIRCQASMQPSVRIFLHASAAIQRSGFTFFPQGRTKWLRCSQPRQLNPNEAALPGPSFLSRSGKANQTSQPSRIADILTYAFRNSESKMTLYLYVSTLMSFYLVYLLVYDNVSCLRGDYTI